MMTGVMVRAKGVDTCNRIITYWERRTAFSTRIFLEIHTSFND